MQSHSNQEMIKESFFKLFLRSKIYYIPSDFPNLSDVDPNIYSSLITNYQYDVKSNVDETIFQSFINYWVKNEVPHIQVSNLIKYEMLSQEFDLMKGVIYVFKQHISNPHHLSLLSTNDQLKSDLQKQKDQLHKNTINYGQIIHHLLKNTGISSYSDFLMVKHDLFCSCLNDDPNRIDLLTRKKIEGINGLAFTINEVDLTAGVLCNLTATIKAIIPRSIEYNSKEYPVTIIHQRAFYKSQIKIIEFEENSLIENIDDFAFSSSSIQQIRIPSKVKRIGVECFFECQHLTKIDFEENSELISIEKDAFLNDNISNFTIPSCVENIYDSIFCNINKHCFIHVKKCNKANIQCYEEKFILKKIDSKSDTFDILLLADKELTTAAIPSFIKIIAPYSFYNCEQLETVEFSKNSKLIRIEDHAFEKTPIESILIPSSVSFIGDCAFECEEIKKIDFEDNSELVSVESFISHFSIYNDDISITIPSSVIEINDHFLYVPSCKNITIKPNKNKSYISILNDEIIAKKSDINSDVFDVLVGVFSNVEELKVPSSIKKIAPYSFYRNHNIKSVEFAENSELNFIEENAFQWSHIHNFKIPPHVVRIGDDAFDGCEEIESIQFSEDSEIQFIGKNFLSYSPVKKVSIPSRILSNLSFSLFGEIFKLNEISILSNDGSCILYENKILLCKSDKKSDIYDVLLFGYRNIEEVKVPFYVKKIAQNAFCNCFHLKKIEFDERSKLIEICDNAFTNTQIVSISIPSSVRRIGDYTFQFCESLVSVEIPENSELTFVGKSAFENSAIERLRIPSHLKTIENSTFYRCENLKTVEFPPDSELEKISYRAFAYSAIEKVSIPQKVYMIGLNAFHNCEKLISVEFGANSKLSYIENEAFCGTMIESIVLPKSVTKLCQSAFGFCAKLKTVKFSENSELRTICNKSFSSTPIENISIPSSVVLIENDLFNKCKKLKKVEFAKNSGCSQMNSLAFADSSVENISIPSKTIDIKSGLFSKTSKLIVVQILNTNNLFKYEKDFILSKSNTDSDVFDVLLFARRDIMRTTIPSHIKIIAPYAFNSCKKLRKVTFAKDSQLESIGDNGFSSTALKRITIPSSVKTIGIECFSLCDDLTTLDFSENSKIERIGQECLKFSSIKKIKIPPSLKVIESFAFHNCVDLELIDIPENSKLEYIGSNAFCDTFIYSFFVPSPVSFIGREPFLVSNINIFEISDNCELKEISKDAFMTLPDEIVMMTPANQLFKINQNLS